jgi:hypothetical protein
VTVPSYAFIDESTGKSCELVFAMKDAPPIGATVEVDGKRLVRVVSDFQVDPATNRSQYPYVSSSLPRRLAGCKTNSQGKPIIESRRHERNVMAQHGYEKE